MLLVCFFLYMFFFKAYCSQQLHSSTGSLHERLSSVLLFETEVCACVIVWFSWGPVSLRFLTVIQTENFPFSNLENNPQVTEAIDPPRQGLVWYIRQQMKYASLVLNLISFSYVWILHWWLLLKKKLAFMCQHFSFFLNRKKSNTTKYYCINICSRWWCPNVCFTLWTKNVTFFQAKMRVSLWLGVCIYTYGYI